ncbi:hypothetical protein COO60DRAFT_383319 [Scenedesmus sp. NREL 46B-D3]|nr:hypothetical protein COO60DRAFT_383319 [Scenedesmus sp. NREL 46B-D3]
MAPLAGCRMLCATWLGRRLVQQCASLFMPRAHSESYDVGTTVCCQVVACGGCSPLPCFSFSQQCCCLLHCMLSFVVCYQVQLAMRGCITNRFIKKRVAPAFVVGLEPPAAAEHIHFCIYLEHRSRLKLVLLHPFRSAWCCCSCAAQKRRETSATRSGVLSVVNMYLAVSDTAPASSYAWLALSL